MSGITSLTSANATFLLSVDTVYPTAQKLQGFGVDSIFDTDDVDPAEVVMGVDGNMSAGWVPVLHKMRITLQADSLSNSIFDSWFSAQKAIQDIYRASGTIILGSDLGGTVFTLSSGVLSGYRPIPDAKKILQQRVFSITWNNITQAPT